MRVSLFLWIGVAFAVAIVDGSSNLSLRNLFQSKTSTEPPTTTTTARTPLFIHNQIPKVDVDCTVVFKCKKKLKHAVNPCVKYCVKHIDCAKVRILGTPDQCVELNEQVVLGELEEASQNGNVNIMRVAMIDFPCQPGYLPDSRGRCREVW